MKHGNIDAWIAADAASIRDAVSTTPRIDQSSGRFLSAREDLLTRDTGRSDGDSVSRAQDPNRPRGRTEQARHHLPQDSPVFQRWCKWHWRLDQSGVHSRYGGHAHHYRRVFDESV